MTAPTGLLEWGQSGTFNAKDDRIVITALANGKAGIVKAATFAAGSGLTMNVGPFLAICDCGDSTLAVAGTTTSQAVTLVAGPGSGSRTDIVWLDIDPTNAAWSINLRTQADTVGRLGVKLGQVLMPQNSNLATQATMTPSAVSWVPFPQPVTPVAVSLYRSTPVANIVSGAWAPISGATNGWTTEETGAAGTLWSVNGFIVPTAGLYLISAHGTWGGSSNVGYRTVAAQKNGTQLATSQSVLPAGATANGSQMPMYPTKCVAGDVLSAQFQQTSGVNTSLSWAQMTVAQLA